MKENNKKQKTNAQVPLKYIIFSSSVFIKNNWTKKKNSEKLSIKRMRTANGLKFES